MAKTYKVLVNGGSETETKPINVMQGVGDKGSPVRIVAQKGVRYELQDEAKGKGAAPDQVRVKRVGKNLTLMFDGSQKPDVVVEDFYAVGSANDGNLPVLAGLAENGSVYEYIPQDPALNSVTPALADGNTPVLMALGGGALGDGFVLSALPIAAAAGGVGGWAIAGGALGAAALAGGGGGGGGAADTTPPGAATVVVPDAADGSVNATEAQDGTAVNVTLPADALVGDTVSTLYTRPDGTKQTLTHVLTAADIAAKSITQIIPVADLQDTSGKYIDGTWTLVTTVTDAAKNVSTPVQSTFVLDTTAPTADSISGNLKHDADNDTGAKADDSITTNSTPVLVVQAETGATVDVVVNGKTYRATESTTTAGEYEVLVGTKEAEKKLADNAYTPSITVTDKAGNKTTKDGVAFTVDTSSDTNPANGTSTDKNPSDLNSGDTTAIAITAVSEDTGSSATDFITSDRSVLISGTVANFYSTAGSVGDVVHVQIFDTAGKRVAHEFVTPNNGTWSMATPTLKDGDYTLKADIVDAAGNVVKTAEDRKLVVSQTYFVASNDAAIAQESGITENGQSIPTVNPTGNVLTNDLDVNTTGRVVTKVFFGGTAYSVPNGTTSEKDGVTIQGTYGTLTIGADGSYKYTVDDARAQSLKNTPALEKFSYEASNSAGTVRGANLDVTVKGANDAASFDPSDLITASMQIGSKGIVSGQLKVIDPDAGDESIVVPTNLVRSYGTFAFSTAGATTNWTYQLKDGATLAHGKTGTDSLTVQSHDGSASETITVTITGTNSSPVLGEAATAAIDSVGGNQVAPTDSATKQLPPGATQLKSLVVGSDSDNDPLGVAITSVDTTHGKLWYTTDLGQHWHGVPNTTSVSSAFLLNAQSDDTWVYYHQTSEGVDHAFEFVAWDQTVGQVGGVLNASSRGDGSALSIASRAVVVDDVFNLSSTANLSIHASTGADTIRLIGQGLTLDLTGTSVSGVEKIDLTGNGDNTVKLNWGSLMQADQHQLTIDGDAGDVVQFVVGGNTEVVRDVASTNTAYNIYHVTTNYAQVLTTHDLLIQQAITNFTFI
jgi:VCBS repeat-containing protein